MTVTSTDTRVPADELVRVKVLCTRDWNHASSLRFVLPVEYPRGTYETKCAAAAEFRLPARKNTFWRLDGKPEQLLPHVGKYLNVPNYGDSTAAIAADRG